MTDFEKLQDGQPEDDDARWERYEREQAAWTMMNKALRSPSLKEQAALAREAVKVGLPSANEEGQTPLGLACAGGALGCVQGLLAAGANPDGLDPQGRSAASLSCSGIHASCEDCLDELIRAGADLELPDANGWTPAHWAAKSGRSGALAALGGAGANLDAREEDGWTPAMRAARYGREGCLRVLGEAEVDWEAKNAHGLAARDLAATAQTQALIESLELRSRCQRPAASAPSAPRL